MANKNGTDWLSWGIGIGSGVLLWQLLKPKVPTLPTAPVTEPAKFQHLGMVSLRIQEVWKEYKAGKINSQQALKEADELASAANSFSLESGEDASVIYAQALALRDSIENSLTSV